MSHDVIYGYEAYSNAIATKVQSAAVLNILRCYLQASSVRPILTLKARSSSLVYPMLLFVLCNLKQKYIVATALSNILI